MNAPQRNFGQKIMYMARLYSIYLKLYFRTLIEYRADTTITLVTGLLTQAGSIAFIGIIFLRIPKLAGWNLNELLFLFGVSITGRALSEVFLNVPYPIMRFIRTGRMDVFMVRPAGALFQSIGISQEINGLGSAITGIAVIVYAAFYLHLQWGIGQILYLILAIGCSTLIYYGVLMFLSVLSFWFMDIRSAMMPIAWLYDFTRYPLEIFRPFIRGLLTYVFPYALGTFYPAAFLIRPGSYTWVIWVLPAFTIIFTAGVYVFWRFALNRYSSGAG